MDFYKHSSYKDLLRTKIKEFKGHRGIIAKLAEAAGCQRSYLSQVLNTHVHLTPDHALGISGFLNLNEDETSFFLLLVDHDRAGTRAMKERLSRQLEAIRKRNANLEGRLQTPVIAPTEAVFQYYTSWVWAAVHVAVSIPELRTPEKIARRLQVPVELVSDVLQGLSASGLIKKTGGEWIYAIGEQHLSRKSPLVALHHGNWRNRAVLSAQTTPEQNYHYTGISSVSRYDMQAISDLLLNMTEKIRKIIAVSKEEELICLNMDFFKV